MIIHAISQNKMSIFIFLGILFAYSIRVLLHEDYSQSKTLLTINERGSKIARNSVFDCHLSPAGRQMAIKNSVSNDF